MAISGKTDIADTLRDLGATEVIPAGAAADLEGIDLACDTVGGAIRLDMLRSLVAGGRLLVLGNASGEDPALSGDEIWLRNISVAGLTTDGPSPLQPLRVAAAASRALEIALDHSVPPTVLPLAEAGEAHRRLEAGAGGKFVLEVEG